MYIRIHLNIMLSYDYSEASIVKFGVGNSKGNITKRIYHKPKLLETRNSLLNCFYNIDDKFKTY